MAMTEREFLTKVLATDGISDEMKGYATESIAKLDARNDKRKNTQTKAQKENVETMKSIVATITTNGAMFASDIGTALGISTQKASALCKLLVTDGTLSVADVKVKNKGAVKQYSLATPTAEEPSADDEGVKTES
jgi:predicted O-methyltransferase YrrM